MGLGAGSSCLRPYYVQQPRAGVRHREARAKASCRTRGPQAARVRDAKRQEQRDRLGSGLRQEKGADPCLRPDIEPRLQFSQHLCVPWSRNRTTAVNLLCRRARERCTHTAVAEVGFRANPRFRGVLESEIPTFEVERLPASSGSLEESAVAQGMKGNATRSAQHSTLIPLTALSFKPGGF